MEKNKVKPIKFNLIIHDKPIRNLDDLRNNFNIEDILDAYKTGLLKRWLDVQELTEESEKVDKIGEITTEGKGDDISYEVKNPVKAAKELAKIFGYKGEKELKEAAYIFEFREKEKKELQKYEELKKQKKEVIENYHEKYDELVAELEMHGNNYEVVKSRIEEIYKKYEKLFLLDVKRFYEHFKKMHPLVILGILANKNMRLIIEKEYDIKKIYKDLDVLDLIKIRNSTTDAFYEKWRKDPDPNQPGVKTINTANELQELIKTNINVLILDYPDNVEFNGYVYDLSIDNAIAANSYPFTYIPVKKNHIKKYDTNTNGEWDDFKKEGSWMIIHIKGECHVSNVDRKKDDTNYDKESNGKFIILEGINYRSRNTTDMVIYMEI